MFGRLIKVQDTRFQGNHPGGVNVGHTRVGYFENAPTVGERFNINNSTHYTSTSMVTEIISEEENLVRFRTLNSIYELKIKDNDA